MKTVEMDDAIEKIKDEIAKTDIPERIMRLVEPLFDIVKEIAQVIGEILAEGIIPKTIPPRDPVRSIGGKPQTKGLALRMPYRARAGARHT